jgi:hypothetical protein
MGEQLRLPDLGLHDLREFVLHHLPAISIARFSAVSQVPPLKFFFVVAGL